LSELMDVQRRSTPLLEMVRMEQEIIARMQSGNQRTYSDLMLVSPSLRIATGDRHTELSPAQREVVDDIFLSREKIVGLDGVAGTGKNNLIKLLIKIWRRGWDLNPRYPLRYVRFRGGP